MRKREYTYTAQGLFFAHIYFFAAQITKRCVFVSETLQKSESEYLCILKRKKM